MHFPPETSLRSHGPAGHHSARYAAYLCFLDGRFESHDLFFQQQVALHQTVFSLLPKAALFAEPGIFDLEGLDLCLSRRQLVAGCSEIVDGLFVLVLSSLQLLLYLSDLALICYRSEFGSIRRR